MSGRRARARAGGPGGAPAAAPGGSAASTTPPPAGSKAALAALRSMMEEQGLAAYIVPSSDAHASEYTAERDKRRQYISGFSGSAGTAVITAKDALVWTDGRYFTQAEAELKPPWRLMKDVRHAQGRPGEDPSLSRWLADHLPPGSKLGIDPWLVSVDTARRWTADVASPGVDMTLTAVAANPVDAVWGAARPAAPPCAVWPHPVSLSGRPVASKLAEVRTALDAAHSAALLVTALDDLAWVFNLRGWGDVAHSPVFHAYGVITLTAATLFVDAAKLGEGVVPHLTEAGVTIRSYGDVVAALGELLATPGGAGGKAGSKRAKTTASAGAAAAVRPPLIWADGATCSQALAAVGADRAAPFLFRPSPLALAKAVKSPQELAGLRAAHLADGASLVRWLHWLDGAARAAWPGSGGYFAPGTTGATTAHRRPPMSSPPAALSPTALTETTAASALEAIRAAGAEDYVGLSFPTIAAVGAHAAVIHYTPSPGPSDSPLSLETIFLCDSGAQYKRGTTDVTRTLHLGAPTDHEASCCTRVLQGHIALDGAVFPPGTMGIALDALARHPLWRVGLNYNHGTGHGVGAFLCVHEGPHYVGQTQPAHDAPLSAGMTVTDEPGYYEEGRFGVRWENVMEVVPADTPHTFGGKTFLKFAKMTYCPVQLKLVDGRLLSDAERDWINSYHAECRSRLSPSLQGDADAGALAFLMAATEPMEA